MALDEFRAKNRVLIVGIVLPADGIFERLGEGDRTDALFRTVPFESAVIDFLALDFINDIPLSLISCGQRLHPRGLGFEAIFCSGSSGDK